LEWAIYFKIKAEEAEKFIPKMPDSIHYSKRGRTFVRRGDKIVML